MYKSPSRHRFDGCGSLGVCDGRRKGAEGRRRSMVRAATQPRKKWRNGNYTRRKSFNNRLTKAMFVIHRKEREANSHSEVKLLVFRGAALTSLYNRCVVFFFGSSNCLLLALCLSVPFFDVPWMIAKWKDEEKFFFSLSLALFCCFLVVEGRLNGGK